MAPDETPPADATPTTPAAANPAPGTTTLLFDRWDTSGVEVADASLRKYINLHAVRIPHTSARHANKPFGKQRLNIVERLVNVVMKSEMYTGKKSKAYTVVHDALAIVEQKTKQNPIQVLVRAIEKAAPREEVTRCLLYTSPSPRD